MKEKQVDSTESQKETQTETQIQKESGHNSAEGSVSRRDLAKAGVAAPVIMSLFSRPVWGEGGKLVCAASALASANVSTPEQQQSCDGRGCTPGFWKNNLDAWATTSYSPGICEVTNPSGKCMEWNTATGTTFESVFEFAPAIYSGSASPSDTTMLDVMLEHELAGSLGTYENHLVAAVLNASAAPGIYGSEASDIIAIAKAVHYGQPYQGVMIDQADFFQMLVNMNEAGDCFLNAHGEFQCGPGYVYKDGACVPSCSEGYWFDVNSQSCIAVGDWDDSTHKRVYES